MVLYTVFMSTCKLYYIPNILPILGGCSKPASSGVSRLFPVFITGNLAEGVGGGGVPDHPNVIQEPKNSKYGASKLAS